MLMIRIACVIVVALFTGACASATGTSSGPQPGGAVAGVEAPTQPTLLLFGAPITVAKPADIDKLASNPASFEGQALLLEGTVKEVCQGKGCWVEVMAPSGTSFMARSLDHSILLPKDCQGRKIMVQGILVTTPEKEEDHEAHGQEGHECPAPRFVVSTKAVRLAAE
jgi:hypothetical protein